MTWKSHQIVTFTTVFVLSQDVFASIFASFGSAVPDKLEGPFWQSWHRTYTHWFVLYLPFLVFLLRHGGPNGNTITKFLFWIVIGALFHILEDAICGTIPVWHPTKKKKVFPRLFYVGSLGEKLFVTVYVMVLLVIFVSMYKG